MKPLTALQKMQRYLRPNINRILAVKYNLKIWGEKEDDLCETCHQTATLEHFLFNCPNTMALWNSVQKWWKAIFHFEITLTVLEVIFGIPNENNDNAIRLYNYVILYTKRYIYTTKKQQKDPQLFPLILMIKQELKLKAAAYTENKQLHKFNRLWGELYDNL